MENILDMITISSVILNVVLVTIIYAQFRRTGKQYELINRPWLVFKQTDKNFDGALPIWSLTNIGNIPAKKIEITATILIKKELKDSNQDNESTFIDKLEKIQTDKPITASIIMPKQKFEFIINKFDYDDIRDSKYVEMNVFIKYQFLNYKKTSQFRFNRIEPINYEEIDCIKAD